MQSIKNISHKKKSPNWIIMFISGFIAGAVIIAALKYSSGKKEVLYGEDNTLHLIYQTDSLQSRFGKLQQLNENYASALSNKNLNAQKLHVLDSINVLITHSELGFLMYLDRLEKKNPGYNKNAFSLLTRIIDGYRSAIDASSSLNTIRNSFNIGNTNFSFDQDMLNSMQNELRRKEMEIVNLNNLLQVNKTYTRNSLPADYKKMIKQQDTVLNKVLVSERQKNENLKNYNTRLQQDYDRLNEELQTLRNTNAQNQIAASATVSKEELNEQVNLAKADCYLARADTKKIISNDKQRRELLQNALQILNTLSQSGNLSVRQQAQVKLTELKTIAANDHD